MKLEKVFRTNEGQEKLHNSRHHQFHNSRYSVLFRVEVEHEGRVLREEILTVDERPTLFLQLWKMFDILRGFSHSAKDAIVLISVGDDAGGSVIVKIHALYE